MKAKLVLDEMPKHCGECELNAYSHSGFKICTGKGVWLGYDPDFETKPDWCPLEPVGEE